MDLKIWIVKTKNNNSLISCVPNLMFLHIILKEKHDDMVITK